MHLFQRTPLPCRVFPDFAGPVHPNAKRFLVCRSRVSAPVYAAAMLFRCVLRFLFFQSSSSSSFN